MKEAVDFLQRPTHCSFIVKPCHFIMHFLLLLSKVGKKKFVQRSFYFGMMTQPVMAAPPQETRQVLIPEHMRGSISRIMEHF
jgi:hypothetical protein